MTKEEQDSQARIERLRQIPGFGKGLEAVSAREARNSMRRLQRQGNASEWEMELWEKSRLVRGLYLLWRQCVDAVLDRLPVLPSAARHRAGRRLSLCSNRA